jgi:hypothetical protein
MRPCQVVLKIHHNFTLGHKKLVTKLHFEMKETETKSRNMMVKATKKVRFDEQVSVLHMTAAEHACDSHFDSNFNHECHEEEEEAAAINDDFPHELPYFSLLPTIESTAFINSLNFSNAIAGSKYHRRSRWMMSNSNINDIPPILPFRQSKDSGKTIISSTISILDWPQDALPPSIEYTMEWARAA